MDYKTIKKGMTEVECGKFIDKTKKLRKKGAGRKKLSDKNHQILKDLETIMDENTAGDPMSNLKWSNKSTYAIASELRLRGHKISEGPNFFYTVTLPCTLWFFDKGKKHTERKDNVLFIDARSIYRQIDRAHREFTPEQIEFIANIVRLYREEPIEMDKGSLKLIEQYFPEDEYRDIPGLCRVATIEEIIDQVYSLNPGRYVGVAEKEEDDFDFSERLHELNEELERLNLEAHVLEEKIVMSRT